MGKALFPSPRTTQTRCKELPSATTIMARDRSIMQYTRTSVTTISALPFQNLVLSGCSYWALLPWARVACGDKVAPPAALRAEEVESVKAPWEPPSFTELLVES